MFFHFPTRKIIEAAAVLLRNEPGRRMSYLRLLKLLYIADRESLKETARPIIGGRPVAMNYGPLHSKVYNLIKGEDVDEPEWSRFILRDRYNVELREDPGVGQLSRYEIRKLNQVFERHANETEWDLVGMTHAFAEWKKNFKPRTSRTIPLEDILRAVGRGADRAAILKDAREKAVFDRLFGL